MQNEQWYPSTDSAQVMGRFEWFDQPDIAASIEADQHKFRKIIVLRHKVIGSANNDESLSPMKPHNAQAFKDRFPQAWAAFDKGELVQIEGTQLNDPSVKIEGLDAKRIELFKLSGLMTLEQLAGMSDAQCQAAGFGVRTMRAAAQKLIADRALKTNAAAAAFMAKQMAETASVAPQHGQNHEGKQDAPKNKGGRPKGSRNKPKAAQAAA